MQKQHTASGRSRQDHADPSTSATTSLRTQQTRRKFQFLAAVKLKLSSHSGRKICKAHKVSHRLVADVAEEIVTGRYPSLASRGYVFVSQQLLGERLKVHERQVRRAVAALVELGSLRVERDHRCRRTNLMTPLLNGSPLFEEAGCMGREGANPSSNRGARAPSAERASAPSNFKREEDRKDSSPVAPSIADAIVAKPAPLEEEFKKDLGTVNGAEFPNPSVTPSDPKSAPSAAGAAAGSAVEVNFATLMRLYPHPAGQQQQFKAYEPHALASWRKLTHAEKARSVEAAPTAPGSRWLGHWLDRGRETGNFEVVERQPTTHRVWVREGTPPWNAWEDRYRTFGRRPLKTQRTIGDERQTGWMFESEWPPVVEQAPSPEVCDE